MTEWTLLSNFGRGHYEVHLREIILNLVQQLRRCCLKIFSIYSSGGHFVRWSITIWAILVEGFKKHFEVKLFKIRACSLKEKFTGDTQQRPITIANLEPLAQVSC